MQSAGRAESEVRQQTVAPRRLSLPLLPPPQRLLDRVPDAPQLQDRGAGRPRHECDATEGEEDGVGV